jgi:hypothetical protein
MASLISCSSTWRAITSTATATKTSSTFERAFGYSSTPCTLLRKLTPTTLCTVTCNHRTRRLTLNDNYNIPLAWTPDSREVIFSSQRAGIQLMFRQALDQGSTPQSVTPAGDTNFYVARLSPDGAWILLEGQPRGSHKMAIYRVDLKGGVPQHLFDTHAFVQFWCTNKAANLCVFGRPSEDKNELTVAAFDPLGGPGKEQVRIPLEPGSSADIGFDYTWQLSPNGSWIGIVKRYGNQIRLVPLAGGQTITMKGYSDLLDLNWANDSQSMFVSTLQPGGATLSHIGLKGALAQTNSQFRPSQW